MRVLQGLFALACLLATCALWEGAARASTLPRAGPPRGQAAAWLPSPPVGGGPERAAQSPSARGGPERAAQSPSARGALKRAAELRRQLGAARGRDREALRARILAVYRSVGARWPAERALVAEACFRAGELLRASGAAAEAGEEFERARALGAGTDWRARAGLELGHLARRAEHHEEALGHYRAVLSSPASASARRASALLWAGRSCAALGRDDQAHALWEQLADEAEDPRDRVAAHDELALAWIAAGDLEAAAGELERCRVAVRERAAEDTPLGERVRSALRRMRAVERLRRAIAQRRAGVVIER